MKVYLVEGGFNYENSTVFGVKSTPDKAERMRAEIEAESIYDWVSVSEFEVDEDEPEVKFAGVT